MAGPRGSLRDVARVFLKLGLIGFGGPLAHIALMRREVVEQRRWISDESFLDLFAASNLIPGPTSTEVGIFLGYERAGWPGLVLAGVLFILPATLIVLALAWAYVRFGTMRQVGWILYGITPAVIGVVADAIWKLGRTALRSIWLLALAMAVLALYLAGISVLVLLFGAAVLCMVVRNRRMLGRTRGVGMAPLLMAGSAGGTASASFSLITLFLTFLKIGAVLYGGGYVLLAFVRADFVTHLHWLTDRQLVDAVAAGQVTPGPLFTTATFIGYLSGGVRGALLATVAIFLPSFVFVAVVHRFLPRMRRSPWAKAFLDGATAAALGLMAAVTWQLARAVVVDLLTGALALAAFAALRRFRFNPAWLILGGAVVGVAAKALTA